MASKIDDIPLMNIDKNEKSGSNAKPNGDSDAAYGYAVTVDAAASEKLLDGKNGHQSEKAALEARLASNDFTGLTKEELAKFSKDPYWRKVRMILFALFWIIWVFLLVAAIIIIVLTPKCPPRPEVPFYQKDAVYKVLPLSFASPDGNGWGKLTGLEKRLPYIKSLGVTTVAIGPIFEASSTSLALYDTIGNNEVDNKIGHFKPCLEAVTKQASKLGMKVLVEAQINFASVNHNLFRKQLESSNAVDGPFLVRTRDAVKDSSIIGRDGLSAWRSISNVYPNGSSDLVYYSSFTPDVVEWDFSNKDAQEYAQKTIEKLVNTDIDGVIVKDASFLVECDALATTSETNPAADAADQAHAFWKVAHPCTMNSNGSVALVRKLAEVVAKRNAAEDRRKRVLLVELAAPSGFSNYADFVGNNAANGAFLDTLTHVGSQSCSVECVRNRIDAVATQCVQKLGAPLRYPLWQFSSPEYGRFTTRFGDASAAAILTLGSFLPGGFGTYYGDEVAMADVNVSRADSDKLFFDARYRSTMQWTSAQPYAGFAYANATLATGLVGPSDQSTYLTANALTQQAQGYGNSRSSLLLELSNARLKSESAHWGTYYPLTKDLVGYAPGLSQSLIAFARVAIGFDPVVVVINGLGEATNDQVGSLPLKEVVCAALRKSAEWSAAFASDSKLFTCESGTILFSAGSSTLQVGKTLPLANVFLEKNQVLVIRVSKASA